MDKRALLPLREGGRVGVLSRTSTRSGIPKSDAVLRFGRRITDICYNGTIMKTLAEIQQLREAELIEQRWLEAAAARNMLAVRYSEESKHDG